MYICNSQAIKNKLNYFWSVVMEKERKKQRKNYIFTLYIIYNNNKKKAPLYSVRQSYGIFLNYASSLFTIYALFIHTY